MIKGQLFWELCFTYVISFLIYHEPTGSYYCARFTDQNTKVQKRQRMWVNRMKLLLLQQTLKYRHGLHLINTLGWK